MWFPGHQRSFFSLNVAHLLSHFRAPLIVFTLLFFLTFTFDLVGFIQFPHEA
jgi:hypothetical protein